MGGQRPPRAAVRAAVRSALADLVPGDRVVVALSGGADSLALTAATVVVGADLGLLVEAAVVDHQVQAGSADAAARAAGQARMLGCSIVHVEAVDGRAGSGTGGPEAAARTARFQALDRVAGGGGPAATPPAAAVLLGHTLDDQAETVLLGLARGSGTRSLAGMAPVAGRYRRPLLALRRDVVRAAAAESAAADRRLRPWSDPHNADAAFTRVRVRASVIPQLERSLGPGVTQALARTAGLAREDADALDMWADRVWAAVAPAVAGGGGPGDGDEHRLPVRLVNDGGQQLPAAVLRRVVRRFLLQTGCPSGDLTARHLSGVAGIVAEQSRAEIALPGGRRARREAGDVVVRA